MQGAPVSVVVLRVRRAGSSGTRRQDVANVIFWPKADGRIVGAAHTPPPLKN
jgi:hypothetical protein